MARDIEKLLEEMTKVIPENLSPQAKKLFNTINSILDERDSLLVFKNRCQGALAYIEDRKENICIDHYNDLKYILNESSDGKW